MKENETKYCNGLCESFHPDERPRFNLRNLICRIQGEKMTDFTPSKWGKEWEKFIRIYGSSEIRLMGAAKWHLNPQKHDGFQGCSNQELIEWPSQNSPICTKPDEYIPRE